MKKVICILLILIHCLHGVSQVKMVTSDYAERLSHEFGLAKITIEIDKKWPKKWIGVRSLNKKLIKRPWRYKTLKDEKEVWHVNPELAEINIALDSQILMTLV